MLLRIRDADVRSLEQADIPSDVRAVLYRGLSRERDLRFPSATAFAAEIEEIIRRRRLHASPQELKGVLERLGLTDDTRESGDAPPAEPTFDSQRPTATIDDPQVLSPRIYRARTVTGVEFGPMSYPKLVELFATGRLESQSLVSRETGEFPRPERSRNLLGS